MTDLKKYSRSEIKEQLRLALMGRLKSHLGMSLSPERLRAIEVEVEAELWARLATPVLKETTVNLDGMTYLLKKIVGSIHSMALGVKIDATSCDNGGMHTEPSLTVYWSAGYVVGDGTLHEPTRKGQTRIWATYLGDAPARTIFDRIQRDARALLLEAEPPAHPNHDRTLR